MFKFKDFYLAKKLNENIFSQLANDSDIEHISNNWDSYDKEVRATLLKNLFSLYLKNPAEAKNIISKINKTNSKVGQLIIQFIKGKASMGVNAKTTQPVPEKQTPKSQSLPSAIPVDLPDSKEKLEKYLQNNFRNPYSLPQSSKSPQEWREKIDVVLKDMVDKFKTLPKSYKPHVLRHIATTWDKDLFRQFLTLAQ